MISGIINIIIILCSRTSGAFLVRSAADAKCIKRTWLARFPRAACTARRPVRYRLTAAHAPVIVIISDEERPLK